MSADRIIGAIALLLAAVYLYATAQIPTLEIGDPLGPKAFPRLLGIALVIAAVLLFIETLKAEPAAAGGAPRASRRHLFLIGGVTLWTLLYFWAFDRAGYVVATITYLVVLTAVFNRGKWLANMLTAVLFALATYGLFVKVLGVALPSGLLAS